MAQFHRLRHWFLAGVRPAQPLPVWFPGIGVAGLALFLLLSLAVLSGGTLQADDTVELDLHVHDSATLTTVMQLLTDLGYIPAITAEVVVADAILLFVGRRLEALLLTGVMIGEGAWDSILKFTFRRPRPLLFPHPSVHSFSFPSGHAFATLCLVTVILALVWRHLAVALRIVLLVLAGLLVLGIGTSRVYLGVHYPSDVVGGWLAALAWLGRVAAWAQRLLPSRRQD
ncbi:MAG: phosphatase PAP2 family protein [Chloroflexota bacterium]